MSTLRPLDIQLVEQIFESSVERGAVLSFSTASLATFLGGECDCNLSAYLTEGSPSLDGLVRLLEREDNHVALQAVQSLWEYRENRRLHEGVPEGVPNVQARLDKLLANLQGAAGPSAVAALDGPAHMARITQLREEYEQIVLESVPQRRGYMLEAFLNDLFIAWGLAGRKSFKVGPGEQIDGSFSIDSATYLVEAKWEAALTAAAALNNFHMKVQSKSAWTRGLFVSQAGYTADGLEAFRVASARVICLDGADLREAFLRGYPLPDVIRRKARRFDETGYPFISVKELYRA